MFCQGKHEQSMIAKSCDVLDDNLLSGRRPMRISVARIGNNFCPDEYCQFADKIYVDIKTLTPCLIFVTGSSCDTIYYQEGIGVDSECRCLELRLFLFLQTKEWCIYTSISTSVKIRRTPRVCSGDLQSERVPRLQGIGVCHQ
jgi:hypothetical protein